MRRGRRWYPRKWNHDFIDLPFVKDQKQPSSPGCKMTGIVAAPARNITAYCTHSALLVDCDSVRRWGLTSRHFPGRRNHQNLPEGVAERASRLPENGQWGREVDLHPKVAAMLKDFIGERKEGLLFRSKTGKPLSQSNVLRRSLHPVLAHPRSVPGPSERICGAM